MKTLEERFDKLFKHNFYERGLFEDFVKEEIERALDAVVPEEVTNEKRESMEKHSLYDGIQIGANRCREELLKNIEEYKKNL